MGLYLQLQQDKIQNQCIMMLHRQIIRIYGKYFSHVTAYRFVIGKSNLHIEQFKIKAQSADTFDDMKNILRVYFNNQGNYIEQKGNTEIKEGQSKEQEFHKFNPSLFAIACRSYARIIRRTKHNDMFNSAELLGLDYSIMKQIDLRQLGITELVDIANFLCMVPDKTFVNPTHPTIKKFVNELLVLILKPYKQTTNQGKQTLINAPDRQLSYLLKSARCAEMYLSPLYSEYLTCITAIIDKDIDLFYGMASMNFISKGKASSKDFLNQLTIVQAALDKYIREKWLSKNQIHHIIDFLTPLEEFFKNLSFLESRAGRKLLILREQLREQFIKQYESMSGEQITRVIKLLAKYNQNEPLLRQILTTCFDSISSSGSTTIDPIFTMRFILFAKNFTKYQSICPTWQQKVVALVKYYFITKFDPNSPECTLNQISKKPSITNTDRVDVSIRSIFNSLVQCMEQGMLTFQNSVDMIKIMFAHVNRIRAIQSDYFNKNISIIFNLCALFLRYRMMQEIKEVVRILGNQWPEHFRGFLYYVHLQFIEKYVIECSSQTKHPQYRCARKNLLTKSMGQVKTSSYLNQTYQTLKLKNQSYKVPMYFLQSAVGLLKYTQQYSEIIQVINNLPDNCAQIELIAKDLLYLPIPQIHHDSFIKCFNERFQTSLESSRDSRYVRSYPLLVLHQLKHQINTNMRQSSNQAKYYHKLFENIREHMKMVESQQQLLEKYRLVYCDHVIITFFMKFNRKQFMESVLEIAKALLQQKKQTPKKDTKNNRKNEPLSPISKKQSETKNSAIMVDQWQLLAIRILSCMMQDSVPVKQVRQFMKVIEKHGFATKQMFLYYCDITIRRGLYAPQLLKGIAQTNNIVVDNAQILSIIPAYPQYTQSVYQTLNIEAPTEHNDKKVSTYISHAHAIMQTHSTAIKLLVLDAIRVTVHCFENKASFVNQKSVSNKLPELLYKLGRHENTSLLCQIKILQVSLNYKLYMPKLFARFKKNAHIVGDYKYDIAAENVLRILTEYPQAEDDGESGWSMQFVNTLISICELCPDFYLELQNKIKEQVGEDYNKPEWSIIKNSLQHFVRATQAPTKSKLQASPLKSGLLKK